MSAVESVKSMVQDKVYNLIPSKNGNSLLLDYHVMSSVMRLVFPSKLLLVFQEKERDELFSQFESDFFNDLYHDNTDSSERQNAMVCLYGIIEDLLFSDNQKILDSFFERIIPEEVHPTVSAGILRITSNEKENLPSWDKLFRQTKKHIRSLGLKTDDYFIGME